MNKEKFEKKIEKKYGTSLDEIKNMSVSSVKSLEKVNMTKLKDTKKCKLVRNIGNTLVKGASIGMGVSGTINTAFPNIIPVAMSALTAKSNVNTAYKILSYVGAASKPVASISGPVVIGVGAGIGAIVYGTYTLIKNGVKHLQIKKDINNAKKLCK